MTPIVWTYLIYLAISIALTVWVAKTLHKNGRIFLVDAFGGNEPLADSVNHLLVVGLLSHQCRLRGTRAQEGANTTGPAGRSGNAQFQAGCRAACARGDALLQPFRVFETA
jgi:hypothetical protein